MLLEGSCHCGAVRFSLQSETPAPFMVCYCSICRKTGGGGGYAINIMGLADSLKVEGREALSFFQARMSSGKRAEVSPMRRYFCGRCGSALWGEDPRWAEWVYPFASAIDTPLPRPCELVHIMENYRPKWVVPPKLRKEDHFAEYPEESIEDWHQRTGMREKS